MKTPINSFSRWLQTACLTVLGISLGWLPLWGFPVEKPGPVPEGARVSLTFTNGGRFTLGDVIDMTFVLSNVNSHPFTYETGGDYRGTGFPTRYKFTVVDEKGDALSAETWMDMGGLSMRREIKPGGGFDATLLLQNYVKVNRPGVFTLRVVHDFGWTETKEKPFPVAEGKITLVLPTPEQAAERVKAICGKAAPLKENELGDSWHQTDFRYLSHPVFLPALEKCASQGEANALEGIQRIPTKDATRAMVRLLASANTNIVYASALFLSRRMPSNVEPGHQSIFGWYGTPQEIAANKALWVPEASEPLRAAAAKLLPSSDVSYVNTGAFIIEVIGTTNDAPLILDALGVVLSDFKMRERPDDNILNAPGAGDALIRALAGLRQRGYRAPAGGGISAIMARFLELADPNVPRSNGWEQLLEAFFTQNPPMLREAAVRALPKPPTGNWEKLLMTALNDGDRGVMRQACIAAGDSKNPAFTVALANIIRTEQNQWVVGDATEALGKIGAHWPAVDAWIERLADEKLYPEALRFLAAKLEHPETGGSSGRTDLPREERIAMREKWQHFFADPKRRALVESGKLVPVSEDQARDLFSGVISLDIKNGQSWPAEKK
ncbi:MAG: hypothetical protein JWM68_1975 [Verrucomicrobiales bacterium]|nr:hypothetical protein [Verrucomicrobiales bacterium]